MNAKTVVGAGILVCGLTAPVWLPEVAQYV